MLNRRLLTLDIQLIQLERLNIRSNCLLINSIRLDFLLDDGVDLCRANRSGETIDSGLRWDLKDVEYLALDVRFGLESLREGRLHIDVADVVVYRALQKRVPDSRPVFAAIDTCDALFWTDESHGCTS